MDHIGAKTKQAVFLNAESHKLHLEFEAEGAVKKGQPVKLTNDGKAAPLGAADAAYLKIGDSIHDAADGELITVMMRGHVRVTVEATAIQNAGPVKWASFETTTGRNRYAAAADAATTQGHALEASAAIGDEITVVLL